MEQLPEEYANWRQAAGLTAYTNWDTFNRNAITQQTIVKFEQNLEDVIKRRAFLWIRDGEDKSSAWSRKIQDLGLWRCLMELNQSHTAYQTLQNWTWSRTVLSRCCYTCKKTSLMVDTTASWYQFTQTTYIIDITNTGLKQMYQREAVHQNSSCRGG